jgi:hypothetical protein
VSGCLKVLAIMPSGRYVALGSNARIGFRGPSVRFNLNCVARPFCSWRPNFLAVAEAFDISGHGGTSKWTDSFSGPPIRFKKVSLTKTSDELTFARILLRRCFRVLQHNHLESRRRCIYNRGRLRASSGHSSARLDVAKLTERCAGVRMTTS